MTEIISSELQRSVEISLSQIVSENIQLRYRFEKTLGEGLFGKVKIASLIENNKQKFAIKSIDRKIFEKRISEVGSEEVSAE